MKINWSWFVATVIVFFTLDILGGKMKKCNPWRGWRRIVWYILLIPNWISTCFDWLNDALWKSAVKPQTVDKPKNSTGVEEGGEKSGK
ncbi:MAG TPA: hypothetical protein VJL36_01460 [Candidatus Paceibacterota bacterium]